MAAGIYHTQLGAAVSTMVGIVNDCLYEIQATQNSSLSADSFEQIYFARQAFQELFTVASNIGQVEAPWHDRLQTGLERSRVLLIELRADTSVDPFLEEIPLQETLEMAQRTVRELARKCNFQIDSHTEGYREGWEFLGSIVGASVVEAARSRNDMSTVLEMRRRRQRETERVSTK